MANRPPPLGRIVHAAQGARERLHELAEAKALREAFAPLGEALWWLTIADDLLAEHVAGYSDHGSSHGGQHLRGLRHARNIIAHGDNPTQVLGNEIPFFSPQGFPLRLAPSYLQWMSADDLPALDGDRDRKTRAAYHEVLAGQPVLPTIDTALEHVEAWC